MTTTLMDVAFHDYYYKYTNFIVPLAHEDKQFNIVY